MARTSRRRAPRALLPIPRDPKDDTAEAPVEARRALWSSVTGRPPEHVAGLPVPLASARGKVENLVGYAQVPIGLAGPLRVDTSAGSREVYVPLATTEGALVASYSRGMRLLGAGAGARSRVVREGLSQAPILVYPSAKEALAAAEVARKSVARFERLVRTTTRHGALTGVSAQVIGRRLVLQLVFTTGDAIGINMAARATDLCSAELARRTRAVERYVHGEDVEKRANARALVEGRGRSVVCEAVVPRAALRELARTTPEALVAIQRTYLTGFAHLGTQNGLVQSANGLAAAFLALGQDVAYVTESATGFLDLELTPAGDLHCAATLPSLLVGTVGGGTGQGTARECLELLGCFGAGHGNTLAELLGAVVLAGDLSLMSAFCAHEFVAAHERLGRNRPEPSAPDGPVRGARSRAGDARPRPAQGPARAVRGGRAATSRASQPRPT
ncbi:MAG: hydroxymethylglutaryl-CoA reductase [Planctomycetes bacterium]|nr:hydroxymethylglutaryl-CoA reductase [Planctomycetota bacterium]